MHEIFKCMEETVYKKAFVHEGEAGIRTYHCTADGDAVVTDKDCEVLIYFSLKNKEVTLNGKRTKLRRGYNRVSVSES